MTTFTTNRPWGATFMRAVAFAAGAAIIGCVTHYAIVAIGGYHAAGAPLLMAMAAGLVVGASIIGMAWHADRKLLACLTALSLICGETYALINTGERTLEQREARLEPIRRAEARRTELAADITKAEAALAALSTTARIEQAIAAQAATDEKALDAIAARSCMDRCKALIEASKIAARQEVESARAELDAQRAAAQAKIAAAKAELADMPVPGTQGILAATIGVAAWKIDLLAAALLSVAANGLGALLVAFAAHTSHKPQATVAVQVSAPANDDEETVLDPGPGTPSQADPVIDWCRAYRSKHGRLPQIPEVQAEFHLSRTTAWRRIKAA